MKLYHKIETLFKFNMETKKFDYGVYYNPNVEILKNNAWVFTEKIDGTNFRIYWNGHTLEYGGRTENSDFSNSQIEYIESNLVNEDYVNIFEQKFADKKVIVYGELYGVKIQNGGLYVGGSGLEFRVFDIEIEDIFLTWKNAEQLANELGYEYVPHALIGTIQEGIDFVLANEISLFSSAKLEGLVGKPYGDFRDRLGKRIVVKIKRRDLMK